jgi:hypothetical protein
VRTINTFFEVWYLCTSCNWLLNHVCPLACIAWAVLTSCCWCEEKYVLAMHAPGRRGAALSLGQCRAAQQYGCLRACVCVSVLCLGAMK